MGNSRSGRWGWAYVPRQTVESTPSLPAAAFSSGLRVLYGAFLQGRSPMPSLRAELSDEIAFRVWLSPDNDLPHATVSLVGPRFWMGTLLASHQPRGGISWRWECPGCGRGARSLYFGSDSLACRRCCGLAYAVQQMTTNDRLLIRMERVAGKVGAVPWTMVGAFSTEPKPPRMHWRTFDEAHEKWRRVYARREANLEVSYAVLCGRLGVDPTSGRKVRRRR